MDNTWGHYPDNRVEWLLDEPARTHLEAYRQAGVVALMFGQGAGGATCACDAIGDGVTNPAPITGNARDSLNADDDGGFFRDRAKAYFAQGPLPLAGGTPATPTPTTMPTQLVPAPVAASCAPRPRVVVTASPQGTGRLQVTMVAGAGSLSAVRIGTATNALIDAGGQAGLGTNSSLSVPPGAQQLTFVVRRVSSGRSTTVSVVVVDGCGDWPTLVGGGPGAF